MTKSTDTVATTDDGQVNGQTPAQPRSAGQTCRVRDFPHNS
jgi:hypothetical protein